jgi:dienelactone hydrolase
MSLFAQTQHYQPTADERRQIGEKTAVLQAALDRARGREPDDLLVDAEVYLKAAEWIVRFDEFYTAAYVAQTVAVVDAGLERARQLQSGEAPWQRQTGSVCRAYRSRVDGSAQPYAVTVPEGYDGSSPQWLEVVLHGRGDTMNEVSFLYSHGRAKTKPADHAFIQLDVYGRGNNAYRWAGETDVFEAIESVKKRYRIDPDRIVLRGFSIGGAGAWHIGLHYPDRWAAMEAGAGFVDTKVYAKIAEPPPYVHIYDAVDYALNAVDVPTVGYGGEDDPQLRASTTIREALEREGYGFQRSGFEYTTDALVALFLIGPKTQHRWHPDSKARSDAFVLAHQSPGVREPASYRFVTWTERYNQCFRVTVDQLERQYERAQVDTRVNEDGLAVTTRNVARLTLRGEASLHRFVIDGQTFPVKPSAAFERVNGRWRAAQAGGALSKQHGLQGPIDDAFTDAFLCVKSPQLGQFAQEFAKWMRGDVRVKSEREITSDDAREYHIVAFGTPDTSPIVAKAVQSSPIRWTRESITVGNRIFKAANHLLALIYPNPANPRRYVVINSGHTFHEADFKGTNALLYPRVGDWAVIDTRSGSVVAEGTFDRNWGIARPEGRVGRQEGRGAGQEGRVQ